MKLRYTALTLISLMALAALAASQGAWAQVPLIERVKITDNEMSCQMIYGEIRQMDSLAAAAPAPAVIAAPVAEAPAPMANAVAQQAVAHMAARSGLGGLFGGLVNAAAQAAPQAAAAQAQAAAPQAPAAGLATQALARKEHLTSLFLGKGCKLSDVQR